MRSMKNYSDMTACQRVCRAGLFVAVLATMAAGSRALAYFPPAGDQPDRQVDAREKGTALTALMHEIRDSYVFPDVADKLVEMLKKQQARGAYDGVVSAKQFAELVTTQLVDISHDRHLRVIYSAEALPATSEPAGAQSPPLPRVMTRSGNYGFEKIEHLAGNVGYLKFNAFVNAGLAGNRVASAMSWLVDTDALIIDLRDNRGGDPAMVQLVASYFFGDGAPVHLNDLIYRRAGTRMEDPTQWWTLPYLPGQRYLDKDVFILTSQRTFSAAEEFAYDLQTRQRATVVGETTGGGANDNDFRRLAEHYLVSVSIGHAINPVTHTNWEGIGVVPDIKVPREQALQTAHRLALQHLIERARDEETVRALKLALGALEGAK